MARTVTAPKPLVESLRRWGVLRSLSVASAVERLDWDALSGSGPDRHARLFAPSPFPEGGIDLSPRACVLLAELLEVRPGVDVALPMPRPRVLTALVEALGGRVHDAARGGRADRSLEIAPVSRAVALQEGGFALRVSFEPHAEALAKRVHTEAGDAEIGADRLPLSEQVPERPIRHLLVVEGFCRRAIEGRPRTRQDELFQEAVDTTWDPPARHKADPNHVSAARMAFHLAYIHQFSADLGDAAELYRASVAAFPTAEAHTFLGWTHSFAGDYGAAIAACEDAVAIDPTFGNPYNDIGAYLLELGRPGEARTWLDRALEATRYEARHFAHCNRGRALLELGRTEEARMAFERSLSLAPGYRPAQELLRRIRG
jgi:tetratricopeptide (TPR) repeat protein